MARKRHSDEDILKLLRGLLGEFGIVIAQGVVSAMKFAKAMLDGDRPSIGPLSLPTTFGATKALLFPGPPDDRISAARSPVGLTYAAAVDARYIAGPARRRPTSGDSLLQA